MKDECGKIRAMFDPYLDGDLSPGEASRLRRHLESCEKCRNELKEEEEIVASFGSLPELSCPEHVLRGIQEAVRDREKKVVRLDGKRPVSRPFRWRWASVGLAAAIAAYFLIWMPLTDQGPQKVAYSPETARQVKNTAKWSLAFAAERIGSTQKETIETVLQEKFPESLKKGLQSTNLPNTGGVS